MKIIELTDIQFKNYAKIHSSRNYMQTTEYAGTMKNYSRLYLGFINENDNTLMGATLLLEREILKFKVGYVPGCFLIDYDNDNLFRDFINTLKDYLKTKKYVYLTTDNITTYKMFAKNKEVQELYQSKWNELAKIREYTAIVEGITDNKGHIESYLKQTKTLLVYSSKNKDGYFAVTDYERIMYNNKYSMLKIHISTGRRNQIRCHMHDIKHPILGDSRYNSKYNPLGRLALHANKLVITNPISKKELTFVSKIPLEFYNLVK